MSTDILIRWTSESGAAIRDMNRVNKALGDTQTAADRNARRWKTASEVMRTAGAAAFGALAVEAVRAGKAAMVQEQAVGGLAAVFKKQAPQMERWAKSMSDYGLSMTDASTYAAQLGASLKGAGIPLQESAELTQRLVELGGDLAATFGGTTSDAVQALGATLRGEYDPLERYGAALKESEVSALIAKRGQDKLTGAALEQAKQAARLDLLWKKTKDAQGQSAREARTSAAAFERLKAKLANIEADLGKALLPFMEDLAAAVEKLADAAERDPQAVQNWAKAIAAIAGSLLVLGNAAKISAVLSTLPGQLAALTAVGVGFQVWLNKLSDEKGGLFAVANALDDIARASGLFFPAIEQLKRWGIMLATITDKLGLTEGAADSLRGAFTQLGGTKVDLNVQNQKAKQAIADTRRAFREYEREHPKADLDASKQAAIEAIRTANQALNAWDNSSGTAKLKGDSSDFRTVVNQAVAWANQQVAVIKFRGVQVSGSAPATRSALALSRAGAATTYTAAPAPSIIVNVNGFTGDEDRLARRVVTALDSAAGRYNTRRYAR